MLKKKSKNPQQIEYQALIYQVFHDTVSQKDFVNQQKLLNTFEIQENLGLKSPHWLRILEKLKKFKNSQKNLLLRSFAVRWNRNEKFSFTKLVPSITTPDSNALDINLKNSTIAEENNLLEKFNLYLEELLSKGYKLELIKDTVIFKDKASNNFKILFSEGLLS
ncbi:Protein of uncharacterised function (DUF2714) [Mycoplasmopsis citelli]|uniref:Protein of uncharacterized function (DUF2714) n=1 Tax=Mycoplasmopsis citelli TaxID=171281 RepID=A0A449B307_9BACT|nr:DUF2714 domain-containing protein [Mycoplasmopsis citelli]VEU74966.1 Protein of uncharacterised function (DUF2714) [Mycoplasmopsis citelli]